MSSDTARSGHDTDYLARRESQERSAAEQSVDPSARLVHEAMANGYAAQLRVMRPAV